MYIVLGISVIVVILVLLLIDKFAPFSEFISSFKKGTFGKLILGLSITAVLSISYGIYNNVTYQPPYLDIQVEGETYTVFGDIGNIGYYIDRLVTVDEQAKMNLVTWGKLNLEDNSTIKIEYPSGKVERWQPKVILVENNTIRNLNDRYGIERIYELEPYTFTEAGDVMLHIGEKKLSIDVRNKE